MCSCHLRVRARATTCTTTENRGKGWDKCTAAELNPDRSHMPSYSKQLFSTSTHTNYMPNPHDFREWTHTHTHARNGNEKVFRVSCRIIAEAKIKFNFHKDESERAFVSIICCTIWPECAGAREKEKVGRRGGVGQEKALMWMEGFSGLSNLHFLLYG